MTKAEYKQIWKEIFARHRVLIRMRIDYHEFLMPNIIREHQCSCISTILEQHDCKILEKLSAGKSLSNLSSKHKKGILEWM